MSKTIVLYRWRVLNPLTGKMIKTRHAATEEDMKVRHPEAEKIESTREERVVSDDPWALSTSAFLRN